MFLRIFLSTVIGGVFGFAGILGESCVNNHIVRDGPAFVGVISGMLIGLVVGIILAVRSYSRRRGHEEQSHQRGGLLVVGFIGAILVGIDLLLFGVVDLNRRGENNLLIASIAFVPGVLALGLGFIGASHRAGGLSRVVAVTSFALIGLVPVPVLLAASRNLVGISLVAPYVLLLTIGLWALTSRVLGPTSLKTTTVLSSFVAGAVGTVLWLVSCYGGRKVFAELLVGRLAAAFLALACLVVVGIVLLRLRQSPTQAD